MHLTFWRKKPTKSRALRALGPKLIDQGDPRVMGLVLSLVRAPDRIVMALRSQRSETRSLAAFRLWLTGTKGVRRVIAAANRIDTELAAAGATVTLDMRYFAEPPFPEAIPLDLGVSAPPSAMDGVLERALVAVKRPDAARGHYWKPKPAQGEGPPLAPVDPLLPPWVRALARAIDRPCARVILASPGPPLRLYVATCGDEGFGELRDLLGRINNALAAGRFPLTFVQRVAWKEESQSPHCDLDLWPEWLVFEIRMGTVERESPRKLLKRDIPRILAPMIPHGRTQPNDRFAPPATPPAAPLGQRQPWQAAVLRELGGENHLVVEIDDEDEGYTDSLGAVVAAKGDGGIRDLIDATRRTARVLRGQGRLWLHPCDDAGADLDPADYPDWLFFHWSCVMHPTESKAKAAAQAAAIASPLPPPPSYAVPLLQLVPPDDTTMPMTRWALNAAEVDEAFASMVAALRAEGVVTLEVLALPVVSSTRFHVAVRDAEGIRLLARRAARIAERLGAERGVVRTQLHLEWNAETSFYFQGSTYADWFCLQLSVLRHGELGIAPEKALLDRVAQAFLDMSSSDAHEGANAAPWSASQGLETDEACGP
jgi:hypothetical protein